MLNCSTRTLVPADCNPTAEPAHDVPATWVQEATHVYLQNLLHNVSLAESAVAAWLEGDQTTFASFLVRQLSLEVTCQAGSDLIAPLLHAIANATVTGMQQQADIAAEASFREQ